MLRKEEEEYDCRSWPSHALMGPMPCLRSSPQFFLRCVELSKESVALCATTISHVDKTVRTKVCRAVYVNVDL